MIVRETGDIGRCDWSFPRKVLAGNLLERLDVLGAGILDDFRRQRGRRAIFIPAARGDPVADELLVERRLTLPRLVPIGRGGNGDKSN
jgi:hypothetical protein